MTVSAGTRLGPYEILAPLGAGGMGEVYRARDPRLDRAVAIKVLPESFARDPERLARFEREAKTLAALNHPNIASVHGFEEASGTQVLVMELVEGPTLADRIVRGPLPLDEALAVARQIAEALEAAHEQGIIHRDLKPANIKVREDGAVKVLDFGLAKALDPAQGSGSTAPGGVTKAPTITSPAMTAQGVILGTAAYMSPEQAKGRPVDRRSDIWAFGCVLYEMLTGKRAFSGDDVSETVVAILRDEPDWRALPAAAPGPIRRLLRRCLEKDPKRRLRDIGDAHFEMDEAETAQPIHDVPTSSTSRRRERVAWISALALITLIATAAWLWRPVAQPPPEVRLEINTPATLDPNSLAISPDGRSIVFAADVEGRPRLWLRELDSGSSRPLRETEGAGSPFWSPDSRSVGFFAGRAIKRIDIEAGAVRTLTTVSTASGSARGAWNRNGVILFSMLGQPIFRVPDTGGEPVAVTKLESQQASHFSPQFLPDHRHFLFWVRGGSDVTGIYLGELGTATPRRLFDADPGAWYIAGSLLFLRGGTLYAQRFDVNRMELMGDPRPIAEEVASSPQGGAVSVSDTGSIAYRTTSAGGSQQFVWFDRSGKEVASVGGAIRLSSPALSRDGQRVVGYRGFNGNTDIWAFDTRRGALSRLTSDAADEVYPVWSPTGDRLVFSSNRRGAHDLYQKSVTAGGREELLVSNALAKVATDWSADGRFVLFDSRDPKTAADLWVVPFGGGGKPFPVVQTKFDEQHGQSSPDAAWIAYQSNESGRDEIYVQRFPGPGDKWPISTNGGSQVRWRRDGTELFYIDLDGRLMAVTFRTASNGQPPDVGSPVALFTPALGGAVQRGDFRHQYMVSPDGQQFLVATVKEGSTSPITVILNWKPRQ